MLGVSWEYYGDVKQHYIYIYTYIYIFIHTGFYLSVNILRLLFNNPCLVVLGNQCQSSLNRIVDANVHGDLYNCHGWV